MAKADKSRARIRRNLLLICLGECCAHCGATENLEFDCIVPKGNDHHRYDTSHRMCFYWREHKLGNLQILCAKCNNKKSLTERPTQERLDFDSEAWLNDQQPPNSKPF